MSTCTSCHAFAATPEAISHDTYCPGRVFAHWIESAVTMPVNPHTKLYNITEGEFLDAVAATEDVPLTREDGTLTPAGQLYVADVRRAAAQVHIWRDGVHVDTVATANDVLAWFHARHSYSVSHAVAYEGYALLTETGSEVLV